MLRSFRGILSAVEPAVCGNLYAAGGAAPPAKAAGFDDFSLDYYYFNRSYRGYGREKEIEFPFLGKSSSFPFTSG